MPNSRASPAHRKPSSARSKAKTVSALVGLRAGLNAGGRHVANSRGFSYRGRECHCSSSRQQPSDLVSVDLGKDHFVAGQDVTVGRAVAEDLLAAGREIVLDDKIGGDAVAAGGTLRLNGNISDNTYAAGSQVFINGTIARNARIAGRERGDCSFVANRRPGHAAGQARVMGSIGGYLQAAGRSLYLDGPIGGDVDATASQVELGPNARINGRLGISAPAR